MKWKCSTLTPRNQVQTSYKSGSLHQEEAITGHGYKTVLPILRKVKKSEKVVIAPGPPDSYRNFIAVIQACLKEQDTDLLFQTNFVINMYSSLSCKVRGVWDGKGNSLEYLF